MFYKIIRDTKGRTWLGSNGNNLFLYQPQDKSIIPVKIKTPPEMNFDNEYMSLYKDNLGALWIGTFNKGVKYYNPNQYYFNHYELKTGDKSVLSVVGNLIEEK
ncbi:hypothetical protein AGMMS50239_37500 [Bacteroidia bacterium]|nr:hypothetical protein AGMMS50239_37500 [Bacteroidia bacterium]